MDQAFVREQLAFARAVAPDLTLSVEVLDRLLFSGSDTDGATDADYDAVQRILVSRAMAGLQRLQADPAMAVDDVLTDLRLLSEFLSDLVSPWIISALTPGA